MNTTGTRRAVIELVFAFIPRITTQVPAPFGFVDNLKIAKEKLMSFAKHCLRTRNPEMLKTAIELPEYDTSDWRARTIQLKHGVLDPNFRQKITEYIFELLFKRRWSTPIPSKFRDTWEAGAEQLLLAAYHDLGAQVPHLHFECVPISNF
jgi:hypothetical protein